jgi:hypothetical protein
VRAAGSLAATALLLGGCAGGGPVVVALRYEAIPAPAAAAAPARPPACGVRVASVSDARANRETAGVIGTRSVEVQDLSRWLAEGVGVLGAGGPADVTADVALQRLYARPAQTQLEGVVALRARLVGPQGAVLERTYRGAATRVNWASAGAELNALFNEALTAAVGPLAEDAARLCAGP